MYKLKLSLALYLLVFLACSKSNVLKNTSEDNLNKIDSVQRAIDQSSIPQKTKNIVTSKYSGYRSVHTTLVNQFIYETSGLVSKWDKDYAHYKTYSYLKDVIFVQNYYNGNYYYEYHLDAQSRIENCYQNSI